MINLACKDITPSTTCSFEVTAENANTVARLMLAHARVDHAADIQEMSDEDVVKLFETKVRS